MGALPLLKANLVAGAFLRRGEEWRPSSPRRRKALATRLAHSNLFIPPTLTGPNITSQGLDYGRLAINLDVAIDVYINRVNGAPCSESEIVLYKEAIDDHAKRLQDRRHDLLIFLKGSKKMKSTLKETKPNDYSYFETIWDLRNQHLVKDCRSNVFFFFYYLVMKLTVFILCVNEESLMLK